MSPDLDQDFDPEALSDAEATAFLEERKAPNLATSYVAHATRKLQIALNTARDPYRHPVDKSALTDALNDLENVLDKLLDLALTDLEEKK